jgi:hypothetical protein
VKGARNNDNYNNNQRPILTSLLGAQVSFVFPKRVVPNVLKEQALLARRFFISSEPSGAGTKANAKKQHDADTLQAETSNRSADYILSIHGRYAYTARIIINRPFAGQK